MAREKRDRDEVNRVLTDQTDFSTIETYKSIRTNIMFSMPKTEKGKLVLVTSAAPNEGKTTTTINLAITFAEMGAKVLLIDCDLRKARIHKYLGLERLDGVSNVLCGFVELEKAIKYGVRENLDCLTAGAIPPNPAELMETEAFGAMLKTLTEQYDYVFMDTPPMTVVTDAAIAMKYCTGVVVVVWENKTTYDALDDTIEGIQKADARILGVVMVDCDERARRYSYYKRGKYGYKYASRYGYKYKYSYHYGDDEVEASEQMKPKKPKKK